MPSISCDNCSKKFHRKPSEVGNSNYCSRNCNYVSKTLSKEHHHFKKFVKSSWTNMNIRAGKYRHLQTESKCRSYSGVTIDFDRKQFESWCKDRENTIVKLERPSIDRVDKQGNYSLDNMQIIELWKNIGKEKTVFTKTHGRCFACKETLPIGIFCKDSRRKNGRTSICKPCERVRRRKK